MLVYGMIDLGLRLVLDTEDDYRDTLILDADREDDQDNDDDGLGLPYIYSLTHSLSFFVNRWAN